MGDATVVASHGEPRDSGQRAPVVESAREVDHRLFGLLAADRVDLGKVVQDVVARERSEVPADRHVPRITAALEGDGEREKILRPPLERERDPHELRGRWGPQNRRDDRAEVRFRVERDEVAVVPGRRQRRGEVAKAQVFLDLRTDERDVAQRAPPLPGEYRFSYFAASTALFWTLPALVGGAIPRWRAPC